MKNRMSKNTVELDATRCCLPHVTHTSDILVLGAGYAGMTAAALLAHEGKDVTVLEAHETLGGCASFFRTGKYSFDVGATTISGMQPHQPAGRVFGHLGLTPNLIKQDPGMIIRRQGDDVVRWADKQTWIAEAQRHFTGDQAGFWNAQYELEQRVYGLVGHTHAIPPTSIGELLALAAPSMLSNVGLLPGLVRPVEVLLKRYGVDTPAFREFIDEQLLISTQNSAMRAPYLTGAMGLTYPSETYYPIGGMVKPVLQLMRHATAHGATVKFRRAVTSITQRNGMWEVMCANGECYHARTVVSSIPIWNMQSLTGDRVQRYFTSKASTFDRSWVGLTLYFALDGVPKIPSTYVQLYLDEPIPFVHSGSLFLTISHPTDNEKAPEGHTTVTASTHALADDWDDCSPEVARERKQQIIDGMLALIKRRMHEFEGMQMLHVEGGTPQTWERYTGRYRGYVGGIPHDIRRPLLTLPPNNTPFSGLYMIGDSVFPGQGTPAVMMGAWNTVQRIFDA